LSAVCKNCVQLESPSLAGIMVGDLLATFIIALAVYLMTAPAKARLYQASDRQTLVLNEGNDGLYSVS
uniref:DNAX-activation protein 10 n=1 Tax=Callorhinchus milii TaxID=7868 RepID=A0A4W3GL13_CALMI